MIPKIIWTIWLNTDKKLPELVQKCIASRQLEGYENRMITLDNCFHNKYIDECLSRNDVKGWVKASDYLRACYVYQEGGIYLDTDVEILKSFDPLLKHSLFAGVEANLFVSNGVFGAVKGHWVLGEFLNVLDTLDGKDDKVFENGMQQWTPLIYKARRRKDATIYEPEYFMPFNNITNKIEITDNTYTKHYYLKSWV